MIPNEDPLWYDREEEDEPIGHLRLVSFFIIVSLAQLVFLPAKVWLYIESAVACTFRDARDL